MNLRNLKNPEVRSIKAINKGTKGIFHRAFTLIELLVVIAIFALIMSVSLWNQRELSNNILITNLAYEIALAVRETQAYGIGVRTQVPGTNPVTSQDFQKAFGLHVDLSNKSQWSLFRDSDGNGLYSSIEVYTTYKFQNQNGNKIVALCAAHDPNLTCTTSSASAVSSLDIVFKRPNPEASFYANTGLDVVSGPVYIVINTLGNNNCRAIVVEATGQIHVESAKSPIPACENSI